MTKYQEMLAYSMTDEEVEQELANVLMKLEDIANATGHHYQVTATEGKRAVLLIDGEICRDYLPMDERFLGGMFEGTVEQLNSLSIRG